MRRQIGSAVSVPLVLLLGLAMAGCPKRPASFGASAPPPMAPVAVSPSASASAAKVPAASAAPLRPVTPPPPSEYTANAHLEDIHFDFDKYAIRSEDARILDSEAAWLRTNHDLLLIEGHCDERGTSEYNLALGERRAQATKSYLIGQGVNAGRITTISYGKERPLCTEHNEACWARNRRTHLLVKAG